MLENLNAEMKIRIHDGKKMQSFDEYAAIKLPYFIRLQTTTFIGLGVLDFLSDGREVRVYLPTEKSFYHGKAS